MIYKGHEIKDKDYVLVEEEPFMEYSSNYVDFNLEDLERLTEAYKAKEKELKDSGIEFDTLNLCFSAQDYDYNPNGPDQEAEAHLYFTYFRPETEKEREDRMLRCMARIDRDEAENERRKSAADAVKNFELEKAKKLLEENGYSIEQAGHKKKKKKKKKSII